MVKRQLQGVNVEYHLHGGEPLLLHNTAFLLVQTVSYLVEIDAILQLQHDFPDSHLFNPCYGRLVRSENPVTENVLQ